MRRRRMRLCGGFKSLSYVERNFHLRRRGACKIIWKFSKKNWFSYNLAVPFVQLFYCVNCIVIVNAKVVSNMCFIRLPWTTLQNGNMIFWSIQLLEYAIPTPPAAAPVMVLSGVMLLVHVIVLAHVMVLACIMCKLCYGVSCVMVLASYLIIVIFLHG